MGWYYRIYNGNYRGILGSYGVGLVKFVVFFGKKKWKDVIFWGFIGNYKNNFL